jgi:Tol biopolymer transport system component
MRRLLAPAVVLGMLAGHADAAGDDALQAELHASPYKILFESYVDDNWELCVMNADGSGRKNLTNTPDVHEMYPQASPDGTKICFLQDVEHDGDTLRSVYYMNADGSGRKLVAEKARQPCWSPDGTKIAYVPQEFSRFHVADYVSKGLFIYDLKTGTSTPHPNAKIHHLYTLNWSKNGRWFVSTVHGGMGFGHAIIAIEVNGDGVYDLKIPGCRPCLSPDGTRVTWSADDHTIRAADVDLESSTPHVSNLITIDHRDDRHLYHPDFSPDGKYITYSLGPGGRFPANGPGTHTQVAEMVGVRAKWNIYLMRSNGEGAPLQLTTDGDLSNKESEWIAGRAPVAAGGSQ